MIVKNKVFLTIVLALALTGSIWSQQEKTLTLEECILSAVANNLNVHVQILNPQMADFSVGVANEKFIPQLNFQYNKQNTTQPSFSWIDAAGQVREEYADYAAQLIQEIPTGARFTATLFSYKTDSNRKFQTINPRFGSTVRLNFTQPLLRDFGFKMARREILVAKNNRNISESQFKESMLQTVYDVESAYWNYVYAVEDLEVKKTALELARDLLHKNRKEVEVGTLAPIEILTAEAEVATREADILASEVMVENNEDILKTIVNLNAGERVDSQRIIPGDDPSYDALDIEVDSALSIAMSNRPDLERFRYNIQNAKLDFSYAKNQLLPSLNLDAGYWSPGVSGNVILYQNNDPLTDVVIGQIPGGAADSLKDALNFKYRNWSIGVTLSVPINTIISRARYAQARVGLEQAMNSLKYQEQQVFLEIRNAVRLAQTNYKRVHAYRVARELAEEKLTAEEKKLKVGMTTNYVVLQQQRDLSSARSAELRAIIDYNLSLAALDRSMGISLDKKDIQLVY